MNDAVLKLFIIDLAFSGPNHHAKLKLIIYSC